MTKIIVHDGKAHQDDFLGACVCIYKLNAPAFRAKCSDENLNDPDAWVLDQGFKFEPENRNFDHHQIKEEICAFTMVLDYFYGKGYREFLPQLRYVEIFDSYGPSAAAKFAEIPVGSIEIISSPINNAILQVFSKIEGEVLEPMYSVMKSIGKEICNQIENSELLFKILGDAKFFEYNGFKIFDTCGCMMPEGIKHDRLPTKEYCKKFDYNPEIILTKDSRTPDGFRMVSINTDNLKFIHSDLSYFTHNSGFLTNFYNYDNYKKILDMLK
jgi:hypothetical protein